MRQLTLFVLSISLVSAAFACNVPVFRYALERWPSDNFKAIVFHDKALSAAEEMLLESSVASNSQEGSYANLEIVRCNVNEPSPLGEIWNQVRQQNPRALPQLVVRAGAQANKPITVFQGPLRRGDMHRLLHSPVRDQLSRRLLSGHAIVWLLLESADPVKNRQTRELLEKSLEDLVARIELPDGIGLPGSELYSEVPLLLRFSVLQIRSDDPEEAVLRNLIRGGQAIETSEPLVVPVFGRGRALEVIPASALTASLILDLTVYLSAACSCQVKERNPGFDLLLDTDWERELFGPAGPPADQPLADPSEPSLLSIPPGKTKHP